MNDRGYRLLPHTADVIAEAWGPDAATCIEEAVAALVSVYAESRPRNPRRREVRHLAAGSFEDMLLEALDEVIFTLDTSPAAPIGAVVTPGVGGTLDLELLLAAPHSIVPTGSVPKAVSRSGLEAEIVTDRARCSFLIDV